MIGFILNNLNINHSRVEHRPVLRILCRLAPLYAINPKSGKNKHGCTCTTAPAHPYSLLI
jgi:hypothetical protein